MTETTKPEPISEARLDELIKDENEALFTVADTEIASALRELKALRQENEWISVETRLPGDGRMIALQLANGNVTAGHYSHGRKLWRHGNDTKGELKGEYLPVKWRPLPTPPAPRTEEQS